MRTGASGQTTVVMSRPSTTIPGSWVRATIDRNRPVRNERTSGTRAIALTTAVTSGSRMASVTSWSPTNTW